MLNGRLLLRSWFVIGIFAIKSVQCDWWLRWMNDWSWEAKEMNTFFIAKENPFIKRTHFNVAL